MEDNLQESKVGRNVKMFLIGFAGLLVVAIFILGGLGIYRVYVKADIGGFALGVAKILRLPAAKINKINILFTDYAQDLKAIHIMSDYAKQSGETQVSLTDEQMSDQVLLRLADNILVKEAAAKGGVTVSKEEVEAFKTKFAQGFKDQAELNTELAKRYGWDFATFEVKVIGPYLLKDKLTQSVSSDVKARAEIKTKAEVVLKQIKDGSDFAVMAKQYGEDGTAANGGELGWFSRGTMVPQFETAAFALKKGELSQQLVETQYGYHIIQVEDRKTEKIKDASGKTVDQESVRARHILFRYPSLDKMLNEAALKASTHLYIRVHNPFKIASSTNS